MTPIDVPSLRCEAAPRCVQCGSDGTVVRSNLFDHTGNVRGAYAYRRCANPACGVLWLDPRPLEEEIHLAYRTYFTHASSALPSGGGRARYKARLYEAAFLPIRLLFGRATDRTGLRDLQVEGRTPGRILDVGCGNGRLLRMLRAKGWQVQGQEVDAAGAASARAHGIPVFVGPLSAADFAPDSFDVITMTHVIEHLHAPDEELRTCWRLLAPGGVLSVTTPNALGQGLQRFGDDWVGLDVPRHLLLFTPPALEAMARGARFSACRAFSTSARADVISRNSLARATGRRLANARGNDSLEGVCIAPVSGPRVAFESLYFYALSNFRLRQAQDSGEECVLWATK